VIKNVIARSLVNPWTAPWLAQATKLRAATVPSAVNQLAKMRQATGDPDARDLAGLLQGQSAQ